MGQASTKPLSALAGEADFHIPFSTSHDLANMTAYSSPELKGVFGTSLRFPHRSTRDRYGAVAAVTGSHYNHSRNNMRRKHSGVSRTSRSNTARRHRAKAIYKATLEARRRAGAVVASQSTSTSTASSYAGRSPQHDSAGDVLPPIDTSITLQLLNITSTHEMPRSDSMPAMLVHPIPAYSVPNKPQMLRPCSYAGGSAEAVQNEKKLLPLPGAKLPALIEDAGYQSASAPGACSKPADHNPVGTPGQAPFTSVSSSSEGFHFEEKSNGGSSSSVRTRHIPILRVMNPDRRGSSSGSSSVESHKQLTTLADKRKVSPPSPILTKCGRPPAKESAKSYHSGTTGSTLPTYPHTPSATSHGRTSDGRESSNPATPSTALTSLPPSPPAAKYSADLTIDMSQQQAKQQASECYSTQAAQLDVPIPTPSISYDPFADIILLGSIPVGLPGLNGLPGTKDSVETSQGDVEDVQEAAKSVYRTDNIFDTLIWRGDDYVDVLPITPQPPASCTKQESPLPLPNRTSEKPAEDRDALQSFDKHGENSTGATASHNNYRATLDTSKIVDNGQESHSKLGHYRQLGIGRRPMKILERLRTSDSQRGIRSGNRNRGAAKRMVSDMVFSTEQDGSVNDDVNASVNTSDYLNVPPTAAAQLRNCSAPPALLSPFKFSQSLLFDGSARKASLQAHDDGLSIGFNPPASPRPPNTPQMHPNGGFGSPTMPNVVREVLQLAMDEPLPGFCDHKAACERRRVDMNDNILWRSHPPSLQPRSEINRPSVLSPLPSPLRIHSGGTSPHPLSAAPPQLLLPEQSARYRACAPPRLDFELARPEQEHAIQTAGTALFCYEDVQNRQPSPSHLPRRQRRACIPVDDRLQRGRPVLARGQRVIAPLAGGPLTPRLPVDERATEIPAHSSDDMNVPNSRARHAAFKKLAQMAVDEGNPLVHAGTGAVRLGEYKRGHDGDEIEVWRLRVWSACAWT